MHDVVVDIQLYYRCREDTRMRASLEQDHRGLGLGRTSDKLSKDDDVNVESRKAMLHYKRTIFCTLREEDKLE